MGSNILKYLPAPGAATLIRIGKKRIYINADDKGLSKV